MNIPELRQKVKELPERLNTRELYTVLLILVVGFGSFGLGRLSTLQEGKSGIRVEQASAVILSGAAFPLLKGVPPSSEAGVVSLGGPARTTGIVQSGGQYVASKTGTKYYFPWCGSASRISEANKIWFSSVEEARKAGYTPASNCKGLK